MQRSTKEKKKDKGKQKEKEMRNMTDEQLENMLKIMNKMSVKHQAEFIAGLDSYGFTQIEDIGETRDAGYISGKIDSEYEKALKEAKINTSDLTPKQKAKAKSDLKIKVTAAVKEKYSPPPLSHTKYTNYLSNLGNLILYEYSSQKSKAARLRVAKKWYHIMNECQKRGNISTAFVIQDQLNGKGVGDCLSKAKQAHYRELIQDAIRVKGEKALAIYREKLEKEEDFTPDFGKYKGLLAMLDERLSGAEGRMVEAMENAKKLVDEQDLDELLQSKSISEIVRKIADAEHVRRVIVKKQNDAVFEAKVNLDRLLKEKEIRGTSNQSEVATQALDAPIVLAERNYNEIKDASDERIKEANQQYDKAYNKYHDRLVGLMKEHGVKSKDVDQVIEVIAAVKNVTQDTEALEKSKHSYMEDLRTFQERSRELHPQGDQVESSYKMLSEEHPIPHFGDRIKMQNTLKQKRKEFKAYSRKHKSEKNAEGKWAYGVSATIYEALKKVRLLHSLIERDTEETVYYLLQARGEIEGFVNHAAENGIKLPTFIQRLNEIKNNIDDAIDLVVPEQLEFKVEVARGKYPPDNKESKHVQVNEEKESSQDKPKSGKHNLPPMAKLNTSALPPYRSQRELKKNELESPTSAHATSDPMRSPKPYESPRVSDMIAAFDLFSKTGSTEKFPTAKDTSEKQALTPRENTPRGNTPRRENTPRQDASTQSHLKAQAAESPRGREKSGDESKLPSSPRMLRSNLVTPRTPTKGSTIRETTPHLSETDTKVPTRRREGSVILRGKGSSIREGSVIRERGSIIGEGSVLRERGSSISEGSANRERGSNIREGSVIIRGKGSSIGDNPSTTFHKMSHTSESVKAPSSRDLKRESVEVREKKKKKKKEKIGSTISHAAAALGKWATESKGSVRLKRNDKDNEIEGKTSPRKGGK